MKKQPTPTPKQHQALIIAVIIALLFGAFFLRTFFSLIIFSMIMAFIFNPTYKWFQKRTKRDSSAASLTLLASIFIFIIPLIMLVTVSVFQVRGLIDSFSASNIDVSSVGQQTLDTVNGVLVGVPGAGEISTDQVREGLAKVVSNVAEWSLSVLTSSVSGIAGFFTSIILFIYLFLNLLIHQKRLIHTIKKLNPLGEHTNDLYLHKISAMTKGMVRGQFLIALAQGFAAAATLYVAGLQDIFFFMFMILTFLSIIPLGAGIVTIPIGVVMLLTGNIFGGLVVLIGHVILVTNIDNVLRPRLVPKAARLNSALTLLAVFAGIAMFGFLGIIIGPVVMIIIMTTIQMYIEVTSKRQNPAKTAKI